MWDEITYPFSNFNGATVEVWEWISYFIPHFTRHVITSVSRLGLKLNHINKRGPWRFTGPATFFIILWFKPEYYNFFPNVWAWLCLFFYEYKRLYFSHSTIMLVWYCRWKRCAAKWIEEKSHNKLSSTLNVKNSAKHGDSNSAPWRRNAHDSYRLAVLWARVVSRSRWLS